MNNCTFVVNLTADPEALSLGGRDVMKLRVADNTWGKNSEPRFFDAILGQQRDIDTANRIEKGDEVVLIGTLVKGSYIAKKNGKGVKKGQKVFTDSMPFASIMKVTRSQKFFEGNAADEQSDDDAGSDEAPDLADSSSEDDEQSGSDAPLDGII